MSWDMTTTVYAIAEVAAQNASCSMLVHSASLAATYLSNTSCTLPQEPPQGWHCS